MAPVPALLTKTSSPPSCSARASTTSPQAGQVRGVELGDGGPAAERADLLRGVLGTLPVGVPGDPDVHAGLGQGDGGGPADTRVGTGDDEQYDP